MNKGLFCFGGDNDDHIDVRDTIAENNGANNLIVLRIHNTKLH
jgi:hypothetical protein